MPHFIMDCSDQVFKVHEEKFLINQIHQVANSTGLFDENDIKVRLNPYKVYSVGNKQEDFIHVFAHIMQGRTSAQKAKLSKLMVNKLIELFPNVPNIAMNISDFEKATYCNRAML
ncbi:5-carboxymethyl-2-hydroxymuconate Delta-isomerase [Pseudoalteromonas sp. APAL1]|uniref:5-carboxymethyl-2-hydroxymuconate Delta-isomerase n=1 Tax=Pseudoalteromonas TaxID=53246 RepID=UPI000ED0957C|nr:MULTISPECIES: 5-carboxymethyl-2-hydroxymuconate Delta-isomerase [unclassified Pseudoalteromonas]MCF2919392.1 5-carboxymethyl-2-hydroxymuconate Delta-isomerase [Pseudoalteromonas sp. APAL1]HCV04157.1 5-carboxymethyl-2-hydroxymuconate isomerase [Pseudoalteromonas sp.]